MSPELGEAIPRLVVQGKDEEGNTILGIEWTDASGQPVAAPPGTESGSGSDPAPNDPLADFLEYAAQERERVSQESVPEQDSEPARLLPPIPMTPEQEALLQSQLDAAEQTELREGLERLRSGQVSPDAPLRITVQNGELIVECEDPEAIFQFEKIFQSVAGVSGDRIESRLYTIYWLKNKEASGVASTLETLFRALQQARQQRSGYSYSSASSQTLTITPYDQANALIVFGSRSDRALIEELLVFLDAGDASKTTAADRLSIIPVQRADAAVVYNQVVQLYSDQIQGITLDTRTNSLMVMSSESVAQQIEDLVARLDEQATTPSPYVVRVYQPKFKSASVILEHIETMRELQGVGSGSTTSGGTLLLGTGTRTSSSTVSIGGARSGTAN
ncbi:MAG: secretin N-terminal domain-containing protein, partial [Planctomycetia bacterium]|nr:secretin N-terminal domain-containing protein [Planctomycetia bacterium]